MDVKKSGFTEELNWGRSLNHGRGKRGQFSEIF